MPWNPREGRAMVRGAHGSQVLNPSQHTLNLLFSIAQPQIRGNRSVGIQPKAPVIQPLNPIKAWKSAENARCLSASYPGDVAGTYPTCWCLPGPSDGQRQHPLPGPTGRFIAISATFHDSPLLNQNQHPLSIIVKHNDPIKVSELTSISHQLTKSFHDTYQLAIKDRILFCYQIIDP